MERVIKALTPEVVKNNLRDIGSHLFSLEVRLDALSEKHKLQLATHRVCMPGSSVGAPPRKSTFKCLRDTGAYDASILEENQEWTKDSIEYRL